MSVKVANTPGGVGQGEPKSGSPFWRASRVLTAISQAQGPAVLTDSAPQKVARALAPDRCQAPRGK
jgi:hypothetical protein